MQSHIEQIEKVSILNLSVRHGAHITEHPAHPFFLEVVAHRSQLRLLSVYGG